MKTDNVWFHSTYKFKNNDILIRTVGYAYNPDMSERMIIYVPVETNIPDKVAFLSLMFNTSIPPPT